MVGGDGGNIAEMFIGVLSALLAALVGWFMWDKKRTREMVDNHSERITKIESEMITHSDAKQLINDNLEPLKEDLKDLKVFMKDISEVMVEIRLDIAKNNGYNEAKESRKNP